LQLFSPGDVEMLLPVEASNDSGHDRLWNLVDECGVVGVYWPAADVLCSGCDKLRAMCLEQHFVCTLMF
jgi:hypothetical protein